ncbi:MAG: DUF2892 domain-containing protein [Nisaea sp.]|jgi:hypothetical protein|uniref:YgaP family membrane protein n=1 Tax=Nisaea sp. TaxID=2024842 RepID=UPI001B1E15AC|nr:DUF2892 domain-containing protein [Nisaea sp.]MBO6562471.1 DUF2892 domain-containing protein [Nisaea sp.]
MIANVGNLDRLARLVLGVALILAPFLLDLAIFANPLVKWGVPIVGLVFAGTALIRFCPLYAIFGIRTRSGD